MITIQITIMKSINFFIFILLLLQSCESFAQDRQKVVDSLQLEVDRLNRIEALKIEIIQLNAIEQGDLSDAEMRARYIALGKKSAARNIGIGLGLSTAGALLLNRTNNANDDVFSIVAPGDVLSVAGYLLFIPGTIMVIDGIVKATKYSRLQDTREVRLELQGTGARLAYSF